MTELLQFFEKIERDMPDNCLALFFSHRNIRKGIYISHQPVVGNDVQHAIIKTIIPYIKQQLSQNTSTSECVYEAFVRFAFNCPSTREQLIPEIKTTAGQNTISQASMVRILLPLPPLAEQKRIVTKLEELLSLCERLK